MKSRKFFALFVGLLALFGLGDAEAQNVFLDEAIKQSATEIEGRLMAGIKVVVLNFRSPSDRLSNYVIDELTGAIVNGGKITVVDRQNLALIQEEMNFQLSGEVSDESAQEIGKKLGAQSIISGSIEDLGQFYRMRFRVIEVVSAAIQLQPSKNVRKDNQLAALMQGVPPSSSRTTSSSSVTVTTISYPNGLNFSTGRKVGAGFLNMFFGIGSFTMGDWVGGLIVGGGGLVGSMLYIRGLNSTNETEAYVGLAIETAAFVYGFVRPFSYDKALAKKNGTYYAGLNSNPLEHINIALIPGNKGAAAMKFTYSFSY